MGASLMEQSRKVLHEQIPRVLGPWRIKKDFRQDAHVST